MLYKTKNMSLPTNSGLAKDKGCAPVSSNCVVWQGPDLDCIGLCKGDTISDVIFKMATELCTLIEMFDLEEFDFTCLAVPASEQPNNMGGLIQILIERICALEEITPTTGEDPTATDCPENCIVPIAPCFYFINPQGDQVTTMSLLDYVTAIGNQICDILDDITVLQNEVDTLQAQQAATDSEIVTLQAEKVDEDALQYQVSTKTNPSGPTEFITDALRDVENSLIRTQDALGTPTELYQNILKEGFIGDEERLFGTGSMNTIPGWTANVQLTAESIGNLWLAVDDLRKAVDYIQENCCSTGCTDIFLNFRATLTSDFVTTFLNIFTDGSTGFSPDWKECLNDTRIVVTDALGNTTTFRAALIPLIDTPSGYTIDLGPTPIDPTTDITVVAETCFTNTSTETTCEKDYDYVILATPDCPATVLTVYSTAVAYQFTATAGYTYIVNVYYNGGTVPVATQIISQPGTIVAQSIFGLLTETDYELEVVLVDGLGEETPCTRIPFTTLPDNCVPPIGASVMLTI